MIVINVLETEHIIKKYGMLDVSDEGLGRWGGGGGGGGGGANVHTQNKHWRANVYLQNQHRGQMFILKISCRSGGGGGGWGANIGSIFNWGGGGGGGGMSIYTFFIGEQMSNI